MTDSRNILHLDAAGGKPGRGGPVESADARNKGGKKSTGAAAGAGNRKTGAGNGSTDGRKEKAGAVNGKAGASHATVHDAALPAPTAMPENVVFALDIGTRTVIGVVGVPAGDGYDVLDVEVFEHESRAMLDGQIHDIGIVASGARRVKEALEARLGYPLKSVAIAAAGRVLKTCQVHVERDIDETREIDQRLVSTLEMEGIQKAQSELENGVLKNERTSYYCVGYSVVTGWLNDFPIANLLGHKGYRIGMDILCTFLPHVVVDSLYSVMDRIGLEVSSLTLEPIAALNIAIPRDLRMLNLALVDIGAGTSDIAITKGGTVIAYAMAPTAGDEVTEAIAQQYLVDFNTAEAIKLACSGGQESISFHDILDNEIQVTQEEVAQTIQPVIQQLAQTITERILEYNGGKAPNAVFMVGGGSQVTGLARMLSDMLGLPKERVAVRNRSIAKNIRWTGETLSGPECITPFGILVTTGLLKGQDFFHVTVNETRIKLYNSRKLTVSDALLLAGYNPDQLIGKSGKTLRFTVNGMEKTVRGGFAVPSEISVNEQAANLTTRVNPGDIIRVKPAERGEDAVAHAGDYLGMADPVRLLAGTSVIDVRPVFRVNGVEVGEDTALADGDMLVVEPPASVGRIAELYEIDTTRFTFHVNRIEVPLDLKPESGMEIVCRERHARQLRMAEADRAPERAMPELRPESVVPVQSVESAIPVLRTEYAYAASQVELPVLQTVSSVPRHDGIHVTVNGESVFVPTTGKDILFVDVFNHIRFDMTDPHGTIVLLLNGADAGYTDTLKQGDVISIYWKDS